jgi:hypothetical protein
MNLLLFAPGQCSMTTCRPYSEWVHSGSSFTPAMAASRLTSTSNGTIVRRSSGSTRLERRHGFRRKEISRIRESVEEHREQLLEGWNEFFPGGNP